MDLSRREFMHSGTVSLAALQTGGVDVGRGGLNDTDTDGFQEIACLLGPSNARPTPGDDFFSRENVDRVYYAYLYRETDTGEQWFITHESEEWQPVAFGLHDYDTNDLPPGEDGGILNFDRGRGTPGWWDRDHYEFPTFVEDVETDDDEVTNTTVETEILRFETNPGGLVEGRVFILRNFGIYNTAASQDQFFYRTYIGEMGFDPIAGEGTLVSDLSTVQENVADGPWLAKTTTIIDSEGVNGQADTHTEGRFNDTPNDDHTRNITIDTTTGEEFVATIQWNNAKEDNIARQDMSYLQQQG